ncbi:PRK06851 family protein [Moorella sulfitireducens (nom. illeg.)]|uniref:PRK06851 family protein n=1 Tax=Neomoorella sulfitireducens TaxID=2972948 RepID=UPI0021AD3C09|nr:PRK06851 family protein [Moorella sulfitireducens]
MGQGKLRRVFPGGNTCEGFYSFYDYIIEPDATRIFIVKGGPGVGKSTFMRKIGETMLAKGYDVEYHCCSSDNGSLDAVVIPTIKVALIDGTAPHIVDPKNPGAVDEIIHLGDYWDESKMRAHKDEILKANARVSRLFQIAYSALREAKVIRDEWESYICECMIESQVNKAVANLINAIFNGVAPRYDRPAKIRHLFATAITPDGIITGHVESLLQDVQQLYTISGEPGSGVPQVLARIADLAREKGLYTEIYHCPFNPRNIDLVIIPEIKVAAMNVQPPHTYDPSSLPDLTAMRLNLSAYIDRGKLTSYTHEINSAAYRYQACLDRAVAYIRQAKLTHDYIETFYIPAMNFEAINAKRQEVLQRILAYAAEFSGSRALAG